MIYYEPVEFTAFYGGVTSDGTSWVVDHTYVIQCAYWRVV